MSLMEFASRVQEKMKGMSIAVHRVQGERPHSISLNVDLDSFVGREKRAAVLMLSATCYLCDLCVVNNQEPASVPVCSSFPGTSTHQLSATVNINTRHALGALRTVTNMLQQGKKTNGPHSMCGFEALIQPSLLNTSLPETLQDQSPL